MFETIQKDFVKAMKEKDKESLNVIQMLKGSIVNEEINKKDKLTDDEIVSIVVKQVKMRKDAITDFEKAGRNDLVESYQKEIDLLSKYLPEQLSIDEVNKIIDEVFDQVKPTSPKDMGLIMKEITPKVKGKADMGYVSKTIKEKISNL